MKTLRDFGLLFKRSFLQSLRNKAWFGIGVATPLLYLALFAPLLQKLTGGPGFTTGNTLDVFLPGILAFLAFNSGTSGGWTTIFELQEGYVERIRVTPVSRLALLVGPILSSITYLFIFSAVLVAVAMPFGFHLNLVGMLVMFVLLALTHAITASFAVSIALLTRDMGSMASVVVGISLPVLLLSGVLLPLTLAPTWERILAHINPLYYVVEADRLLAQGNIINGTVGLAFLVMVILTGITLWWATRVFRKAVA
jgi:ABC-2 type transport system permease protein